MKKTHLLLLFLFFLNSISAQLIDPATKNKPNVFPAYAKDASGLTLTFSDEFDVVGAPNSSRWGYQDGMRKENKTGPDGYWSKEDAYHDGLGNMVIRLRAIPNKNPTVDADSTDYSTGAIVTQNKFTQLYGKYEINCQLPTKSGWWVAFWMMQGVVPSILDAGIDGSEVDIMEGFGWTNKINHAIHWDGYLPATHKNIGKQTYDTKLRTGFHRYTLEWNPTEYVFYIDGVKVWTTTGGGICIKPGYLLVTGEISTSTSPNMMTSGWASTVIPKSYPDYFLVDYVRVWNVTPSTSLPSLTETANDTDVNNLQIIVKGNEVQINSDLSISNIQVCDITGKIVAHSSSIDNSFSFQLKQGIYIIVAKLADGSIVRKKIQV